MKMRMMKITMTVTTQKTETETNASTKGNKPFKTHNQQSTCHKIPALMLILSLSFIKIREYLG
jgi:hypothetical protein